MWGKKKMRKLNVLKNIIASSIVFTMSAVLGLSGVVSPKAANNVKIQKYEQKGEKLNIAFSGIKDPKEKNTKVIIGEQEFQVDKIENAEDYGKGISYIFLVDVSGSVSRKQYDFMEHIMKSLVKKSNVDNIKIILVGETVKFFDNESGKKDTMIDKIKSIRERAYEAGTAQTNLYKGIVDALEAANNDSEMNLVRSLVIFSDGFEEKGDSLTQNEVLNAVREQRVPVFTVPVESGISVGGDEDTNEILSSFARNTVTFSFMFQFQVSVITSDF